MNRFVTPLAAAALALTAIVPAQADVFVSQLNSPNDALAPYGTDFGTVTVNLLSSTTAQITFDAASGFLIGGAQAFDLNTNGTVTESGFVFSSASSSCAVGGCFQGAGNVNGHGVFNAVNDMFDGFGSASDTVTYQIALTSGTWASAADVLTANASGFDAAAHIFVCDNSGCIAGTALATGFVGEGPGDPPITAPEPGTLTLIGSALLGFGLLRRRKA
jgi:hypothetical protein